MILFLVIAIVTVFVAITVFVIVSHIKKLEKQKYYVAAGNILREDMLNYSLQNTMQGNNDSRLPTGTVPMIYIKSKANRKKISFVFDPQKQILLGRDRYKSNIFINETYVSNSHCIIKMHRNRVFLQDLNSANGVVLKRRLWKTYFLKNGEGIFLKSKDKIVIGNISFKILIFYFDTSIL